ncbi:hypothetical protein OESDEN_19872 [Oesophagostomum dentatum]|uniref:VOC domain-containing protein n=1 Tax=Oesophagostomum dentatum TaxID=61180 RepID=A0A0B1S523_OESDE|nr:hypothetical protein OESDEN_19872 [Oesophagostomum dentatum]
MTIRALHYVLKVGNRKAAYEFFTDVLRMKALRHEEYEQGCKASCNGPYNGKWSKTMIGYGSEDDHFVFELTYNYEICSYKLGNDLRGITIESDDLYKSIEGRDGSKKLQCGTLQIHDPDGHCFFICPGEGEPRVVKVGLMVQDIQRSVGRFTLHRTNRGFCGV